MRPRTKSTRRIRDHGFTMIEIIVVIVILGIMTGVAIVRSSNTQMNSIRGAAHQFVSDVAYAQEIAIAEHRGTQVVIGHGTQQPPGRRRCFVATVCYGEHSPQVRTLRSFRDQYLEKSAIGRSFIRWYYANGPTLADYIGNIAPLRVAVKISLIPIILIVTPFVEDAHALGLIRNRGRGYGRGRARRNEDGGPAPNTYSLEYIDGTSIKDPFGGDDYFVELGEEVVITSSNLTLKFDSAGRLTAQGYVWASGATSMVALTLNDEVSVYIAKYSGKTWLQDSAGGDGGDDDDDHHGGDDDDDHHGGDDDDDHGGGH